jgi:hypothetical protein
VDNINTNLKETWWGHEVDSCGSRYGPVAGSCEGGNECSNSIKWGGGIYCLGEEIVALKDRLLHGISYNSGASINSLSSGQGDHKFICLLTKLVFY